MEKITYIIGAGFSAPLGMPVTNNFLMKSKDLYFSDTTKYSYFKDVFDTIESLSVCKNYFESNLFNIEEIFSILEMNSFLNGKKLKKNFIKYIREVILYHSSKLDFVVHRPANWYDFIFGNKRSTEAMYGYFIANLFGGRFLTKSINPHSPTEYHFETFKKSNVKYNLISLNYDLIFENISKYINDNYICDENIEFIKDFDSQNNRMPILAKLHGSVDSDTIIPPTWAKGINKEIAKIWRKAKEIIEDSNQIRFIGYSLPQTDTYIQYLLKAAIINSKHLKNIDVICLDHNHSVQKRYNKIINFNYYRFANANVTEYLSKLVNATLLDNQNKSIYMSKLEAVHENFMNTKTLV